jgi:hypothetical protein
VNYGHDLPIASTLLTSRVYAMGIEERYRAFAGELMRRANRAGDSDHRSRLVEMARLWEEGADRVEQLSAVHQEFKKVISDCRARLS